MGKSSKKKVSEIHPGTLEVVPVVKNKVNECRCRWILIIYRKMENIATAVQCKDNFSVHTLDFIQKVEV